MLRSTCRRLPTRPFFANSNRCFSHTVPEPVDLKYDIVKPADPSNTSKGPLIILHGLLGSKRNWLSLSKAFQKDLNRPIYTLDLRNHGSSPHASPMDYSTMASDVLHFCQKHSFENIALLGHSMGGKVAMSIALAETLPQNLLSHLIIADIAPNRGPLSSEFRNYFHAMNEIEKRGIKTKKEAQDILKPYESDPMVRAFILTNLETHKDGMKFRIPLEILTSSLPNLGDFPYEPFQRSWEGPTLFIKGNKSKYINDHNVPLAKEFFPNMTLERLDTSHWVHSESPNEFKKLVVDFIK